MNQCIQANFDNRSSNEDIGQHLLQIPQVYENLCDGSTFRDEDTERPYMQNLGFKEIPEPEEELFKIGVELTTKRDIKGKEQVLLSSATHAKHNSSVSKYVYNSQKQAQDSSTTKKLSKDAPFTSPRPFNMADAYNEGLNPACNINEQSYLAAKETSPIKKWLNYSKIQKNSF